MDKITESKIPGVTISQKVRKNAEVCPTKGSHPALLSPLSCVCVCLFVRFWVFGGRVSYRASAVEPG